MRVATLADWRKSQIATLKAQLRVVTAEHDRLGTQVADLEVLIESLSKVALESKVTKEKAKKWADDSERDGKKSKRRLSPAHKRALLAGQKRWAAKQKGKKR